MYIYIYTRRDPRVYVEWKYIVRTRIWFLAIRLSCCSANVTTTIRRTTYNNNNNHNRHPLVLARHERRYARNVTHGSSFVCARVSGRDESATPSDPFWRVFIDANMCLSLFEAMDVTANGLGAFRMVVYFSRNNNNNYACVRRYDMNN